MSIDPNLSALMNLTESLRCCGTLAIEELRTAYASHGIEDCVTLISKCTDQHVAVAQEVWNRWHTTTKFKVDDKVYVVPLTFTSFEYCIRATVTEVGDDGHGYRLRAFASDLPGIYMFNIWDKDLAPRTDKSQRRVPSELLLND